MVKSLSKAKLVLTVISTISLSTLALAPSALAFDFKPSTGRVGVTTDDVGQEFLVNFDGSLGTNNAPVALPGLSSSAIFKFLGFTTIGSGANLKTEAAFQITLDNTSSKGITSRTSALGLNVYTYNGTNTGATLPLVGVGNASGSGNTRSTGIFTNDRSGAFPNQFGNVDVCLTNGNSCEGGSNGGVTTANDPLPDPDPQPNKFTTTLAFNGAVTKFALGNFGVRYQSIEGNGIKDGSGTGKGTPTEIKKPRDPNKIPEPSAMGAILLMGLGMLGSGKRKQASQESQAGV